jgi:hypothetical protein
MGAATADRVLLRHRRKVALANWKCARPIWWRRHDVMFVEHDPELMAAIAAWKQRGLDEIDAELQNPGSQISLVAEIEQLREDHQARCRAATEASLQQHEHEPDYFIILFGGGAS